MKVEQTFGRGTQMERFTKTTKTVIRNYGDRENSSSFVIRHSIKVVLMAVVVCALAITCKKDKTDTTIAVESVEVSPATLQLAVGEASTLTAIVEPEEATNPTVAWSVTASSPDGVVTVDKNTGEVTAVKAGTATVTATAGKETADCEVTVTNPSFDEGVVINGVTWATRNVGAPGVFAKNVTDAGMFYQWNRKTAWAATGTVTDWDSDPSTSETWEAANDPSPAGWRIPNYDEQQTLRDTEKVTRVWTTKNGVAGYLFTDIATGKTLFLPATGLRDSSGTLSDAGESGSYWSSATTEEYVSGLIFGSDYAKVLYLSKEEGHSLRLVK